MFYSRCCCSRSGSLGNKIVRLINASPSQILTIKKPTQIRCLSTIKDGDRPFSRTFKRKQREDWYRYSGQFREERAQQGIPTLSPFSYAHMVQPSKSKNIDADVDAGTGTSTGTGTGTGTGAGSPTSNGVALGDKVTLNFAQEKLSSVALNYENLKLKSGSEPMSFVVGTDQVLPAFEDHVIGMQVGDKKRFMVTAENAYGLENPEAKMSVPLRKLHDNAKVGDVVAIINTNLEKQWENMKNKFDGDDDKEWKQHLDSLGEIPREYATVASVDQLKGEVTLNLNDPLAGYNLVFEIEVTGVEPLSQRMESLPPEERGRKVEFSQQIESFLPEFEISCPPYHLEVHYESLSFMFVGLPDVEKIKYPFEMNLDRLNI